jgi:dUTP pyrophosphatase
MEVIMSEVLSTNVNIKKLNPNATIPTYGSEYAAGADLYACIEESLTIAPGETVLVKTGLAMELPIGYAGLIYARSGLASKRGLAPANKVGVIDSDYRGEVMVALHNHSNIAQSIEPNERIAQLVITPYIKGIFSETDDLSDTVRGEGGFGSTGKK